MLFDCLECLKMGDSCVKMTVTMNSILHDTSQIKAYTSVTF